MDEGITPSLICVVDIYMDVKLVGKKQECYVGVYGCVMYIKFYT